eukprot:gb/GFBE01013635.1/.p1 GENE.gb/GFBE01013635.1/~~gb/GFBE01013635.1/.p1  ORF type:complete len:245 (+),score=41.52 gb/GFBE01013635.1/:1-735(+)
MSAAAADIATVLPSAALRALASASASSGASAMSASALKNQQILLGLAAAGGFLFVCACAGLIKAVSVLRQERREESSNVDGRTADSKVVDEQERATILADVYGKAQDGEEEGLKDIGDEAALAQAWKAIERDVSSDEDLAEAGLYPHDDEEDFQTFARNSLQRGARQASPAGGSPDSHNQRQTGQVNTAFFDIGDPGEGSPHRQDSPGAMFSSVNGSSHQNGNATEVHQAPPVPTFQGNNLLGI